MQTRPENLPPEPHPNEHPKLQLESDEEVEAILRLAIRQSNETDASLRERLQATAQELGITPAQLEAAEKLYRQQKTQAQSQATEEAQRANDWKVFKRTLVANFVQHLAVYLVVNIMLLFIDSRDGAVTWAFWPILGWGIGIAAHLASTLYAETTDNLEEFEKWRRKYRKPKRQPKA